MRTSLSAYLVSVCMIFGCSKESPKSFPQPDLATAKQVQTDVERILRAVYAGDIETVDKFTHPKIIQMLGGPIQARSSLMLALDQVQASGMKIESLVFPVAPTFTNGTTHQFAVVPTKLVITVSGQRFESLNYQLGVREMNQTNWSYLEGSRVRADNVKSFFPDFPTSYAFPNIYRKQL